MSDENIKNEENDDKVTKIQVDDLNEIEETPESILEKNKNLEENEVKIAKEEEEKRKLEEEKKKQSAKKNLKKKNPNAFTKFDTLSKLERYKNYDKNNANNLKFVGKENFMGPTSY